MDRWLDGQTALVTGGSRGIGRGCVLALAAAGAAVAVNYHRDRGSAEEVVRQVRAAGGRAMAIQADVADRAAVAAMYDSAERDLGTVSLVISNAGSSVRRSVLDTSEQDLRITLDVQLIGAFHTLQEGARRLVAAGRAGRMIVIGSVHAWMPFPNALSYNIAKAGLHHMAVSMAAELLPYHIHVNVVVPGLTDTPGERAFRSEAELQEAAGALPVRRMGTPEEVGGLVAFLLSPANDYMTGSVVTADGGVSVTLAAGLRSQPGG
jgi:glucose 1-dehydrogenase